MPEQGEKREALSPRWFNAPLIVHRCPNCKRLFDSPSVCMEDGSATEPMVRPIKLVLWKRRGSGEPMGVGYEEDADAVIAVDFKTGSATVFPVVEQFGDGGHYSTGPYRTEGLEIVVVTEAEPPSEGESE